MACRAYNHTKPQSAFLLKLHKGSICSFTSCFLFCICFTDPNWLDQSSFRWQLHIKYIKIKMNDYIFKNIFFSVLFITIWFAMRRLNKYILYAEHVPPELSNERKYTNNDMKYPGYQPELICIQGYWGLQHECYQQLRPLGHHIKAWLMVMVNWCGEWLVVIIFVFINK